MKTLIIVIGFIAVAGVIASYYYNNRLSTQQQPLAFRLDGSTPLRKTFPNIPIGTEVSVSMGVRPEREGVIFNTPPTGEFSGFPAPSTVKVILAPDNTPVLIRAVSGGRVDRVASTKDIVTDGLFHVISVTLKNSTITFTVDGDEIGTLAYIGGWGPSTMIFGENGFVGDIRNVFINNSVV